MISIEFNLALLFERLQGSFGLSCYESADSNMTQGLEVSIFSESEAKRKKKLKKKTSTERNLWEEIAQGQPHDATFYHLF